MNIENDLVPPRPDLVPDEVRDRPDDLVPTLVPPTGTRSRSDVDRESRTTSKNATSSRTRSTTYQHPGAYQRAARLESCRRCALPVLDAVVEGLPVVVDALPLTSAGELAARLAGRHTLNAHLGDEGEIALSFRFARHFSEDKPVLAEHRCGELLTDMDSERAELLVAALAFERASSHSAERPPF